MSLFGENRTVRYDECSVIEVLWAVKRKVTTTLNAAHASHLQCHSIPAQSLTLWHNFPNRVQFEKFCGSSNLTLTFANTHKKPLLLPHFCGLGDLPNGSSISGISSSTRCPFTSALDVFGRRTPSSPWIFPNARHYLLTFCALTHLEQLALIAWRNTCFGHNIRRTLPACRSNCTSTYPLNSIWVNLAQAAATYPYNKCCHLLKNNINYSFKTIGGKLTYLTSPPSCTTSVYFCLCKAQHYLRSLQFTSVCVRLNITFGHFSLFLFV